MHSDSQPARVDAMGTDTARQGCWGSRMRGRAVFGTMALLLVCGRDLAGSLFAAGGLEGASHRYPFLSGVVTAHEGGCACESAAVDFY